MAGRLSGAQKSLLSLGKSETTSNLQLSIEREAWPASKCLEETDPTLRTCLKPLDNPTPLRSHIALENSSVQLGSG
ncbi:hypothetical protein NDU88_005695 [Pleurodeles waltl]|uniref:Uncharacterized protein n=1 Tax=Pleurodeles waltl TaxID=8319 RepID=A0AAV7RMT4_PLEWA|nr:hypothetical protein NDU88_005695 [Pleurodeles waltl]